MCTQLPKMSQTCILKQIKGKTLTDVAEHHQTASELALKWDYQCTVNAETLNIAHLNNT